MRRHRTLFIVTAAVVALLVGLRLALPSIMERTIDRHIARMQNVQGGVERVRLALWRGTYQLEGLEVRHRPNGKEVLHVHVDRIAMSISARALLHGELVGAALVERPTIAITFVDEKLLPPETQIDLAQRMQELFPFRIDSVVVRDGVMSFRTAQVAPADALKMEAVNARIRNITNAKQANESAFASFGMVAKVQGSAPLTIEGHLNPTAAEPEFDMTLSLRALRVAQLNPWLEHYVKAKAETGTFRTTAHLSAADGKFNGYVNPKTEDLEMTGVEERNLLQGMWASLVEWIGERVTNEGERRPAHIPVRGVLPDGNDGVMLAMMSAARSALVSGFVQSVTGTSSGGEDGVSHSAQSERPNPTG